jgi:biopolymer transport protein ExbB
MRVDRRRGIDVDAGATHWFGYIEAGGPLMVPLAICCFLIWGYLIRSRVSLRALLRDAEHVYAGNISAAPVGRLMGLSMMRGADAVGAFERGMMRLLGAARRDIVVLLALTAAAPLLGLLGTVEGMSDTFRGAGALSSATTGRVAGGISRALVTTQFGLVIAIPGLFGAAGLQRLAGRLQAALGGCRSILLRADAAGDRDGEGAA